MEPEIKKRYSVLKTWGVNGDGSYNRWITRKDLRLLKKGKSVLIKVEGKTVKIFLKEAAGVNSTKINALRNKIKKLSEQIERLGLKQ
jgi:hypothetical protein